LGATSAIYTAQPTPIGTDIIVAPTVTHKDPSIKGKIPNLGGSEIGYQLVPVRNSFTETNLKIDNPSLSRKTSIRPTNIMEDHAA